MSNQTNRLFVSSLEARDAGKVALAYQLLLDLIADDDSFSPAYNLLGLLGLEELDYEGAIKYFDKALLLDPLDGVAHCNRGNALRGVGRYHEAIESYSSALRCQPIFPDALHNLACLQHLTGDIDAAINSYERALEQSHEFSEALSGLGLSLRVAGDLFRAESCLRQAILANPSLPGAYVNLGSFMQHQGRTVEAQLLYQQALFLRPDYPQAVNNLGTIWELGGDHPLARQFYLHALSLDPAYAEAMVNLGNTWQANARPDKARACYRLAIAINPKLRDSYYSMGLSCYRELRMRDAVSWYSRALDIDSSYLEARWNRAICLFHLGRYSFAWRDYEYRLRSADLKGLYVNPSLPLWDGQALGDGQSLLLVSEQGLGDTIQFIRYALMLSRSGRKISVCIPDQLHSLLVAAELGVSLIKASEAEEFTEDCWLPLLSLPKHLGVHPAAPGPTDPYLSVDLSHLATWRLRLVSESRPIIAINWQGNPATETNNLKGRSLKLETFAPLLADLPIALLSLQKGHGSEQLPQCSFRQHFVDVQPLVDQTWDFLETASIIQCCDLVITSDTAVAHLSAALGKPTWLLLQAIPDWRWGLKDESTFWYPSMRLFRQARDGDWPELMQRVRVALEQWLTERENALPVIKTEQESPSSDRFSLRAQLRSQVQGFWRWLENEEISLPKPSDDQTSDSSVSSSHAPIEPLSPTRLCSDADQHIREGHLVEAEDLYTKLLNIDQFKSDALAGLGVVCLLTQRPQDAVAWLEQAVECRPDFPEALSNLGAAHYQLGSLDLATTFYRKALAARPEFAQPYCGLGRIALDQSRPLEALCQYRQALALNPGNPEALNQVGLAYQVLREYEAAGRCLQQAINLQPAYYDALVNLGNNFQCQDLLEPAKQNYRLAIAAQPDRVDAYFNLGLACQRAGDVEKAIAAYSQALLLDPQYLSAKWNRAACHLLAGDYQAGWRDYACRLQSPQLANLHAVPTGPAWRGGMPTAGQSLLLIGEQGLGDVIHFLRYVTVLADAGVTLSLCIPEVLWPLVRASSLPVDLVDAASVAGLEAIPWLPLLSLPELLNVSITNPQVVDPYLIPDPQRVAFWSEQFQAEIRPIVALNWQGNPAAETTNLKGRSLPLQALAPLAEDPSISLLSLQKGVGAEQMLACSFADRFVDCQDLVDQTHDFLDTAAILASCDLVVTSDSVIAHLAAAIGRPVWLLLPNVPEWRWGLAGDTSPWYPSMRIFRQHRLGDWSDPITQLVAELQAWKAGRSISRRFLGRGPSLLASFWNWIEDSSETPLSSPSGCPSAEDGSLGTLVDPRTLHLLKRGLASRCLQKGFHAEAERLYRELLEADPADHDGLQGLGALCLLEQRPEEAVRWFAKALALRTDSPEVISNLGTAYHRLGRLADAKILYRQAIALKSDYADPCCNLGCILQEEGSIAEAMDWYHRAIAIQHDHAGARWNLSMCLFLLGRYEEAWVQHEWRLHHEPKKFLYAIPACPRWQADHLPSQGKLLLVSEQGLGDVIQFLRYLPVLVDRGLDVSLCAPESLHSLIAQSLPSVRLLTPLEASAWVSHPWMSLLSLPRLLGVTPDQPLAIPPYLHASADRSDQWMQRLAQEGRPVVAINWQGNPSAEIYTLRGRSLPLEMMAPLAELDGFSLLSLQKGAGSEQLDVCSFPHRFVACQHVVSETWDLLETAAIIESCDLVITSDTAVAHLAGALGKEAWLLLHRFADWRWGYEGDLTFWYPSIRLFRQQTKGDWKGVVDRVAQDLRKRYT